MIGKKAESLVRLKKAGFNVPDFFVITSHDEDFSDKIDENTLYAVRSSGTSEDLAGASFAGQYESFLNVRGIKNMRKAVARCMESIHNERVAAYAEKHGVGLGSMAVIVQKMVDSEKSGVAFSINSIEGRDKEIMIEAVSGLGEKLVSGHANPDYYAYDWYGEQFTVYNGGVLSNEEVRALAAVVLDIQVFFGFPVDVEWAMAGKEIFVLQSRPITTISYKSIKDEWTTADFRDGGVSSAACKPLMGSLYGLIFQPSFSDVLKSVKLLPETYDEKIYDTFFARPYWRLTVEKECFAKLPGFVEREADEDLGIMPAYEGDGIVTKTNLKSIAKAIHVLTATGKHIKKMAAKADSDIKSLLKRFENIQTEGKDAHKIWLDFIKNDYFISEYTYFQYIFCNVVLSALFKNKIKKHLPQSEIMNLMIGLSDLSHMRPIYDLWDMRRDQSKFNEFIEKYKHHSQHELDISYPNWDEMPETVWAMRAEFAKLDESHSPKKLGENQRKKYLATLAKVPKKLHKDVEQLRKFLWWREEFRDVSTKSYYIIRKLTVALGKAWAANGLLADAEDIFFLTVSDIESKATVNAVKNKKYYQSFINCQNPNEIGRRHIARKTKIDGKEILKGVPCSGETVTGTARVIKDIHDADRLQQGDILVTKCTDPAWTAIFSKLGGVITETGGMLSHAAVVSREYGLPCILVVKNATKIIRDGATITMDCQTGSIKEKIDV
ncbi:MAG: hypothetical protein LBU77_00620 [Clostridiales bacterium]|jgi:pyruvate,water dikinase|nr:hypothetical protein [Clostridiales bacterium]